MKYFKTQNLYKASNVTFDPSKVIAHSYAWWCFVRVIEGHVVFNSYRYSNTTAKHQFKVKRLLNELGITIDFEVSVPESLKDTDTTKDLFDRTLAQAAKLLLEKKRKRHAYYLKRKETLRLSQRPSNVLSFSRAI